MIVVFKGHGGAQGSLLPGGLFVLHVRRNQPLVALAVFIGRTPEKGAVSRPIRIPRQRGLPRRIRTPEHARAAWTAFLERVDIAVVALRQVEGCFLIHVAFVVAAAFGRSVAHATVVGDARELMVIMMPKRERSLMQAIRSDRINAPVAIHQSCSSTFASAVCEAPSRSRKIASSKLVCSSSSISRKGTTPKLVCSTSSGRYASCQTPQQPKLE
jgi:hypothetical protein